MVPTTTAIRVRSQVSSVNPASARAASAASSSMNCSGLAAAICLGGTLCRRQS